jgi:beta-glucanase (GH16 family)
MATSALAAGPVTRPTTRPAVAFVPSTADSPYVPAGYVKVFGDEMTSPVLDTSKWWTRYIYEGGMLDTLNDERQLFRENDNHVMTGNTLDLTARVKPTTNPRFQYESGMVRSKPTFKYGYFETRVKMPGGLGVWPAFWLNSDSDANGKTGWPPEIDIFEFVNNGKEDRIDMIHLAVQSKPKKGEPSPWMAGVLNSDPKYSKGYYYAPFNFPDDYHVYAALWGSDDTLEIRIDGKSIVKYKYKWVYGDGKEAPNAHVLLNLSIGGQWAGRHGIDDSAFPQAMSVDYVRVYQKKGEERVGQSTIGKDLLKPVTK